MRFIVLLFSMLFFACTETVVVPLSEDEQELRFNYSLLKAYFYHPERIKSFPAYEGMEVDSMYSDLNDYFKGARYTRYFPPDTAETVWQGIISSDKYYSFGFEKSIIRDTSEVLKDTLIVSAVYPISPAASAGLKKRDKLLFANDEPLTGIDYATLVRYRNSDSLFASSTAFTVLRGTEVITLPAMQKGEVVSPTVYLDSLNGTIPYITVTEFSRVTNNPDGTYAEFKNALDSIKGVKTAVIELRYNPGGNIDHCTKMAAELVPPNNELVYDVEHYYDGMKIRVDTTRYFARPLIGREGKGTGIKWILLMNYYSASCSERFAAAVKYNRPETIIIGQTSYGKGIGQSILGTYLNGLARITSIQTFYPNGETFHDIGIIPDVPKEDINLATVLEAVQSFESGVLAKRQPALQQQILTPMYKTRDTDLGAYIVKDFATSSMGTFEHP